MSAGAAPSGVSAGDEAGVSKTVREMFGRVAPRYDLLNRLLSGRIDVYWRSQLVRAVRPYLSRADARILDLCCGTGDVLLALERERSRRCADSGRVPALASDFCRPMLASAQRKAAQQAFAAPLIEADALRFPLPAESLDLITVAYGFRNLANYRKGLEEFRRLLAPGGCLAILEFSQVTIPVVRTIYNLYLQRILPRIGNLLSGAGGAYSYLQNSVGRFLTPDELSELMRETGFHQIEFRRLTGGVSCLHLAYVEGRRG